MNTPQRRWGGAAYLANWRLSNLKSVADADIDLSPLTVVVGPNSVGKSTLLQSILLLSQSSTDASSSPGTLELNGDLVSFGSFKEARSDFASDKSITVGGLLVWPRLGCTAGSGGIFSESRRLREAATQESPYAISITRSPSQAEQDAMLREMDLQRREIPDASPQEDRETISCSYSLSAASKPNLASITRLAFVRHPAVGTDETSESDQLLSVEAMLEGASPPTGFAPYVIKARFDGVDIPAPEIASRTGDITVSHCARFHRAFPTEWVFSAPGESPKQDTKTGRAFNTFAGAWVDYLGLAVSYLGPLREEPSITHANQPAALQQMPLGRRGEHTATILRSSRDRQGDYPVPGGRQHMSLLDAVNLWIADFGLGEPVTVERTGGNGIALRTGGRDLTQVGTGFSQLLPLIVICLIASPGSLVLLEQPELHLHPASQQKLADFFLAVVRSQRRLLVETHSEYLVSRLRLRVAEDPQNRADFGLVFAESADGRTHFRTVETNDLGGIDDWPAGFFDQQSNDIRSLMRAAVRRLEDENATDR